jgi:hypothetical protein
VRVAIEALRQRRQVWRDIRHGLRGAAAEETLIAAMAGSVLRRRTRIVGMGAELCRVAEDRLELGSDRRIASASESGRGKRRRRRGGEKLNDE